MGWHNEPEVQHTSAANRLRGLLRKVWGSSLPVDVCCARQGTLQAESPSSSGLPSSRRRMKADCGTAGSTLVQSACHSGGYEELEPSSSTTSWAEDLGSSCGEVGVELIDEGGCVGAEVADGSVDAAAFGEGGVVEVVGADACGHCDHLHHLVEPPKFGGAERNTGLSLLGQPPGIPLVDLVCVWDELVVELGGEPDQGYQVGESVPVAVPDPANVDGLV